MDGKRGPSGEEEVQLKDVARAARCQEQKGSKVASTANSNSILVFFLGQDAYTDSVGEGGGRRRNRVAYIRLGKAHGRITPRHVHAILF